MCDRSWQRVEQWEHNGLKAVDALRVACAEAVSSDYCLVESLQGCMWGCASNLSVSVLLSNLSTKMSIIIQVVLTYKSSVLSTI